MNVLLLTQYWYPENGVPQRRWAWLTRNLIASGYRVTVIAPPPHYERETSLTRFLSQNARASCTTVSRGYFGETLIRSPYLPAKNSLTTRALNQGFVALGSLYTIARLATGKSRIRPDVIIGTVPAIPTCVAAWFASKIFRVPYVIDLRDAWPELLQESSSWNAAIGKPSIRQRILSKGPLQIVSFAVEKIVNYILSAADGVITTAEQLEVRLIRRFSRRSTRPKIIRTVRNTFPPEDPFIKASSHEVSRNSLRVLYAGTLGRAQDLDNVVEAYRIALDNKVNIQLRMVGAGAARRALEKKIAELRLDLEIEPRREASDLAEYYEWADTALVHLADWEALSMAVPSKTYELMKMGMHITAVCNGEAAELVRKHKAGIVVPPANPEKLAHIWEKLANNREQLRVSDEASAWVDEQCETIGPKLLMELLNEIDSRK